MTSSSFDSDSNCQKLPKTIHSQACICTAMHVYMDFGIPESGELRPSAKAAPWKAARFATGQVAPSSRKSVRFTGLHNLDEVVRRVICDGGSQ